MGAALVVHALPAQRRARQSTSRAHHRPANMDCRLGRSDAELIAAYACRFFADGWDIFLPYSRALFFRTQTMPGCRRVKPLFNYWM